jgi:hypothetical protein
MSISPRESLARALLRLLRPLARLLLRNGVSYAEFTEYAKRAYVETALEDFAIEGRKPTVSRAAVVTGLTRKEVKRLSEAQTEPDGGDIKAYNRAVRVVTGWVRDADFHDRDGNPDVLGLHGGKGGGFPALVRRYSGDMPVRAVLDELVRVGVAGETGDGRVRLLKRAYVPAGDDAQQLHIFGANVADLIRTIDHNLAGGSPLFQRTVSYDSVPRDVLESWRKYAGEQSQRLLEEFDRRLASYEREGGEAIAHGERVRTGVGIFYFEEEVEETRRRVYQ